MKSKRHTTEQIIGKLRRADIELGKGRKVRSSRLTTKLSDRRRKRPVGCKSR